jgi:hypothetical protein
MLKEKVEEYEGVEKEMEEEINAKDGEIKSLENMVHKHEEEFIKRTKEIRADYDTQICIYISLYLI